MRGVGERRGRRKERERQRSREAWGREGEGGGRGRGTETGERGREKTRDSGTRQGWNVERTEGDNQHQVYHHGCGWISHLPGSPSVRITRARPKRDIARRWLSAPAANPKLDLASVRLVSAEARVCRLCRRKSGLCNGGEEETRLAALAAARAVRARKKDS